MSHRKRFLISEVAADWHEVTIPQRTMRPSVAHVSEQPVQTRGLQLADIPPPQSTTHLLHLHQKFTFIRRRSSFINPYYFLVSFLFRRSSYSLEQTPIHTYLC